MSEARKEGDESGSSGIVNLKLVVATLVSVAAVAIAGIWIFADRGVPLVEEIFSDIESVEIIEPIVDLEEEIADPVEAGFDVAVQEKRSRVAPVEPEEAPPESERLESDVFEGTDGAGGYRDLFDGVFSRYRPELYHATVDRPAYRGEQPVRWRIWYLSARDFSSESGPWRRRFDQVQLLDPTGNRVAYRWVRFEEGAAYGEFYLDRDVPGGLWTLRVVRKSASSEEVVYERPLLVSEFEPPRFVQTLDFERDGYRQGEEVRADLEVHRDTGEPLSGRTVEGYVQVAGEHVADLEVELDTGASAEVSFELPEIIGAPHAAVVLSVEEGGAVETEVWPVPLALDDVEVTLHPEGGELVEGLTSRVYFETTDLSGQPLRLEGSVVDDRGQVIAEVESGHRGRGRFELTPTPGRTYTLKVEHPEEGLSFSLPEAESEGCVMRVYDDFDTVEDSLRVGLWCTEEREVGIVGAMADQIFDLAVMMAGPDEPAVAHLRPDDGEWPRQAGVVRATALHWDLDLTAEQLEELDREEQEELLKPVTLAERVAFRGRRAQMEIDIGLNQPIYHPGQNMEMEIRTRGVDGEPVNAELAFSSADARAYARADHLDSPSILGQLLLKSDDLHFWGDVEDADDYFDLYEDTSRGLDLLMGTRGWRSAQMRKAYYFEGGDHEVDPAPVISRYRRIRRANRPSIDPIESTDPFVPLSLDSGGARGSVGVDSIGQGQPEGVLRAGVGGGTSSASVGRSSGGLESDVFGFGGGSGSLDSMGSSAEGAGTAQDSKVGEGVDDGDAAIRPSRAPRFWREERAMQFSAWTPRLRTGDDGVSAPEFRLTEAEGAYRVVVEGVSQEGLLGRGEALMRVEAPLGVMVRFPESLSRGDVVALPITVRNTTEEALDTQVEVNAEGPVRVREGLATFSAQVPAQSTLTRFVPVYVEGDGEEVIVDVWAQGAGFTDGVRREAIVESGDESHPDSEDDGEILKIDVSIPDSEDLTMGDEVSLQLELSHKADEDPGKVVVRLALPGGFAVSDRELEALVERSGVDEYRISGREIWLYFEELEAGQEKSLSLSATARVPGVFEMPASFAFPDSGEESQLAWSEAKKIGVRLPQ